MNKRLVETIRERDYKLIIFDCDGTLVDSEDLSCAVAAQLMRSYGIDISDEAAISKFEGTSLDTIREFIIESKGELPSDFTEVFRSKQIAVFQKDLKTVPGVKEFLKKISLPICIGSNAPKHKMEMTLPMTGLDSFFAWEHVFSAYDIEKWKPEPHLFLHAAKAMGHQPSDCLVIEDSISGAMGAVNAKMDVLVYCPNKEKEASFVSKDLPVFTSFENFGQSFFQH